MGNHTLYAIGAGVIFFISVLTLNRTMLHNFNTITESSMLLTSASIGQGIIEEAQGILFDEGIIGTSVPDVPVCFTASESLGTEGSESYPLFNDIDDYNGFVRVDSTQAGICSTVVAVGYVDSTNIDQWVSNKGFYKKMEVAIYTDVLPQPIKLHYLFCYKK